MSDGVEDRPPSSNGYTYWKRDIADAHVLPSCEPRKIEHSSSEESLARGSSMMSRWNSGTTYEEKNVTERSRNILSTLLGQLEHPKLKYSLSTFEGEVHAHAIRGKVKIGYELTQLCVNIVDDSSSPCGSIQVEDLDSTDPDAFILTLVNGKGDLLKSEARNLITKLIQDMCTRLLSE